MKSREIWMTNLNPTMGAEMQKVRPAVIVSGNNVGKLPLRVIIPITDWKKSFTNYPWMIHLIPTSDNGLSKPSSADVFQVRSVSVKRLTKRIGQITRQEMTIIRQAMEYVMEDD